LGQYSGCSDVRNTITDRVHTRLRQPNMTRGRCNCKSLINLDILKEHMGSDNGPKALIYIPKALALVSIIASLRELVWNLRGGSDGGYYLINLCLFGRSGGVAN
jgi:hypothetical protein